MTGMRTGLAVLVMAAAPALAQVGELRGYVFWEADGSPPRRRLTIELAREGKVRYRKGTRADGSFEFSKVAEGRYTITTRLSDVVFHRKVVAVSAAGPNFAAIMLPKPRAGLAPFATVSFDQLRQWYSRQSQKRFRKADRLLAAGHLAGAASLYQEILDSTPSADVLDILAVLYLRQGRRDEARRMFEKAVARDPKFLPSYTQLASYLFGEGMYKEAAAVATRALQVDPRWATGHLLLGAAQFRLGDLEAARHASAASEIVQRKWPEPYMLSAKIHYWRGDCWQAREDLKRYLALHTSGGVLAELRESIQLIESCLVVSRE